MTLFPAVTGPMFGHSNRWAKTQPRLRDKLRPHLMTAAEKLINDVALAPVPDLPEPNGIPHITHTGVLHFCGHDLRVYQLSNGKRVFAAEDIEKLFSPPQ